MPPLPGDGDADPSALFWIDLPHGERRRTLGGVVGRVDCRGVPTDWLPVLVLGRHLQAGASTNFGFGRFVLNESLGPLETPARRLVDALADRDRLDRALDHVADQSVAAGVDGVSPARFRDERETRIPALADAVRRGEATASPLLGLPVRREDRRKVRPLAVPTVGDRVLQRAAVELLGGAVDTLFEDCSFAYRKGYSRAGAARAIQKAYRDGFRIVLDADISAFFEEVRWDRLFHMLEALFPGEPMLDLVREWVTAPVHFEGLRLRRHRGLPQGAPVSPLLANLYLDELDDDVLGEDFRLVRYADDFVVLCRDVESAERARDTVEASLAELGLELNEDETFLPKQSWLAQVPLDRIRGVLAERRSGRRIEIIGGV
jgi:group II intron reverse transcriptase/maturase